MFWKKKKRMVDIRDLQKQGIVRFPISNPKVAEMPTDVDGFVELGTNSIIAPKLISTPNSRNPSSSAKSNSDFFGFMDFSSGSSSNSSKTISPSTTPSEDLRKLSSQISNLDNQIYKIEQRIELLERKIGVDNNSSASSNSVGVMGW